MLYIPLPKRERFSTSRAQGPVFHASGAAKAKLRGVLRLKQTKQAKIRQDGHAWQADGLFGRLAALAQPVHTPGAALFSGLAFTAEINRFAVLLVDTAGLGSAGMDRALGKAAQ